MNGLRIFLICIFVAVALYTIPVVLKHGINLFPYFFGDILEMGWAGQFNVDFMGFLMMSALWTAWRNQFSPSGLGLGVLAFFFGAPFLTAYMLYLSFSTNGNIQEMLMGPGRAAA